MKQIFEIAGLVSTVVILCCSSSVAIAQVSLPSAERTNGSLVRSAFSEQREVLQRSSAVLYDGWRNFGYGIVVSKNGHILVKGSELEDREAITVRVGEQKYSSAVVVARSPRWDLALLKIEADDLQPVTWADSVDIEQGSWVVANGVTSRKSRRINIGIVSAKPRAVEGKAPVVLGVAFEAKKGSLTIEVVTEKTGAKRAGLKPGDILKKIEGKLIESREDLIEMVRDYVPGDFVSIDFERKGAELKVEVELMARGDAYAAEKSRNDAMSGSVSKRRDSFPRVLQTDIQFNARTIGGPLLNLEGECVGMNIARANRAESFAIPVKELREVLDQLMAESH